MYGRNFDSITSTVRSKNREQVRAYESLSDLLLTLFKVRHFYYRVAKKVNALLGADGFFDKKNKEHMLIAVICFGNLHTKEKPGISDSVNELLDNNSISGTSTMMVESLKSMVALALRYICTFTIVFIC